MNMMDKMFIKLIALLSVNLFYCFCDNLVGDPNLNPKKPQSASKLGFNECNIVDSLAVYKIIFDGNWSKELFPKHYPEYRPPAHFSKTFGRTHNVNYTLFSVGKAASNGLKQFCNIGLSVELENEPSEKFDEFFIPHLKDPTGEIESRFFVKSNHTLLSLVTKLIPSPDWFIGIDRLNLCRNNKWIENVTIEATPFDCGTDSGLTFTAPKWPTDDLIQRITPRYPRHQASSFYYFELKQLPPIAYYRIQKIKEYVGVKEKSVRRIHQKYRRTDNRQKDNNKINKKLNLDDSNANGVTINKNKRKQRVAKNLNQPDVKWQEDYEINDCIVSDWSEWSNCTKPCGLGEKRRHRQIIKEPKKNGRTCPALSEIRWCGSARGCSNGIPTNGESSYFKW